MREACGKVRPVPSLVVSFPTHSSPYATLRHGMSDKGTSEVTEEGHDEGTVKIISILYLTSVSFSFNIYTYKMLIIFTLATPLHHPLHGFRRSFVSPSRVTMVMGGEWQGMIAVNLSFSFRTPSIS